MESTLATDSELSSLQYAANEAEKIRRRAASVVAQLAAKFNDGDVGSLPKIQFTPVENKPYIATVESDFGNARLTLDFFLGEDALLGRLILQRQGVDQLDRTTWLPAFTVTIPAEGRWLGVKDTRPADADDLTFLLGASMLLAIINGPRD